MRKTLSLVSLVVLACSSNSESPRSNIRYSSDPSTGDCVANSDPASTPGWENCDPTCNADGTCADVCAAVVCDDNGDGTDPGTPDDPSTNPDGTANDPSATGTTDSICPYGYVVGPDGCPTCECYWPCNTDPTPTPGCDSTTDPNCCVNADGTTGENCDGTTPGDDGSNTCDPATGTDCNADGSANGG